MGGRGLGSLGGVDSAAAGTAHENCFYQKGEPRILDERVEHEDRREDGRREGGGEVGARAEREKKRRDKDKDLLARGMELYI